jgi:hypothetical protein
MSSLKRRNKKSGKNTNEDDLDVALQRGKLQAFPALEVSSLKFAEPPSRLG